MKYKYYWIVTIIILIFPDFLNAKAPVLTSKELMIAPPRIIRTCCGFGAEVGIVGVPFAKKTNITSRETLGAHTYMGSRSENNGNIYTKHGGFLDTGHLRDCADLTAYFYNLIKLSQQNNQFSEIELRNEGGSKNLRLTIPENISDEKSLIPVCSANGINCSMILRSYVGPRVTEVTPKPSSCLKYSARSLLRLTSSESSI